LRETARPDPSEAISIRVARSGDGSTIELAAANSVSIISVGSPPLF
jgi:hypothetical protein